MFDSKELRAIIRMMVKNRKEWRDFMKEFEALKAMVAEVVSKVPAALAAKDAEIAGLKQQVADLQAVETIAPADVQAVVDQLTPLEATLNPPAAEAAAAAVPDSVALAAAAATPPAENPTPAPEAAPQG